MDNKKISIEKLIIWILNGCAAISFSVGLILGYSLSYTQYAGILSILVVTVMLLLKPKKILGALFIILALGSLNLISFGYFIDIYFSFGVNLAGIDIASPGIQLYSIILLTILIRKRKDKLKELYQKNFGQTEEDYNKAKESAKNRFIDKFNGLSDNEILLRLKEDLVPEAIEALNQIKTKRGI